MSISIINYQTPALTISAAETALCALDHCAPATAQHSHVVIVDNASQDDSVAELSRWQASHGDDRVRVVSAPRNGGFAYGHNLALQLCKARYTLLLNSDAELHTNSLRLLLDAATAHPGAGLIAPRLEWDSGEPQVSLFRFHRPLSELIRGASSGPITSIFKRYDVPLGLSSPAAAIEWPSFACVLINGAMVESIGPLDEGYFLYFEDADYAWRAHESGWSVVSVPAARCVHHRGGSGPVKQLQRDRQRLPAYYYRSRSRYFYKTGGRLGLTAANLLWTLGHVIAAARKLFDRKFTAGHDRELSDIWTGFLNPMAAPRSGG